MNKISKEGLFTWIIYKLENIIRREYRPFDNIKLSKGSIEGLHNILDSVDSSPLWYNGVNSKVSRPGTLLFEMYGHDIELVDDLYQWFNLKSFLNHKETRIRFEDKYLNSDSFSKSSHILVSKKVNQLKELENKYISKITVDDFKYIGKYSDFTEPELIYLLVTTGLKDTELGDPETYSKVVEYRRKFLTFDFNRIVNSYEIEAYRLIPILLTDVAREKYSFITLKPLRYELKRLSKDKSDKFFSVYLERLKNLKIYFKNVNNIKREEVVRAFKASSYLMLDILKMSMIKKESKYINYDESELKNYYKEFMINSNILNKRFITLLLLIVLRNSKLLDLVDTGVNYLIREEAIKLLDEIFSFDSSEYDDKEIDTNELFIGVILKLKDTIENPTRYYISYNKETELRKLDDRPLSYLPSRHSDKLIEYFQYIQSSNEPHIQRIRNKGSKDKVFRKYILSTNGDPKTLKSILLKEILD